ncbi:hypothetical protein Leryth_011683 [Lithospermum erythrorhizon]|nr:hypothetical protein Leryth_011683 [Lithospermum erythrorhizon]
MNLGLVVSLPKYSCVRGDRGKLKQILGSLNSLHSGRACDCWIDKRHEILGSNWNTVIKLSDSGVGIPKEKQKFVFENYVQVNDAKSGQEGTGLGLGIVQSLTLSLNDASLKMPSQSRIFLLVLELEDKADFTLRGCDGLHTQRPMIGKRVLVAEDKSVTVLTNSSSKFEG